MASRTSSSARSEKNTRTAPPRRKPSPTPSPARRNVSRPPSIDEDEAPGRVRVSVRLRPKNAEELASHADFADFVELQPELKRLVLRKNNWTSESYKFDDVFPEAASQKRVYDAVAKPVVESVLNGYNGTVMAYGQTGSGKTYTLGRLGKLDPSEGGIMVRALDHILSNTSASSDMVAISYLQLYMETLQDLLSPEKSNISIIEDPKIGEVSLPGSTIVKIRDIDHAMQLLEIGERNRCTANTKFNTESSRSHAILVVFVQRTVKEKSESENSPKRDDDVPIILRSKLLIVDLAGSERIDKSGGEGHTLEEAKSINLSLTSLGKCINAIAENSPHIPTRDSKLTRLLRDSFGGSARTSLIVTIGPSGRYIGETTSTLMFGQRAMKIENVVKLREEFDYEALCRKLELRLDYLTAENERGKKSRDVEKKEMENKLKEYELRLTETQKNLVVISESSMQEKHFLEEQFNHVLSDLNIQRERHHLMCEELESLQLSLRQIRVEMQLEMQKHANEPSILCDPQIDCLTLQNGFVREEQLGTGNVEVQDKKLIDLVRLEISACQKVLAGTTQFYQVKFSDLVQQLEDERTNSNSLQKELLSMKRSTDQESSRKIQEQTELEEMRKKLKELHMLHENALQEMQKLRVENEGLLSSRANLSEEKEILQKKLSDAVLEKNCFEDELLKLKNAMLTTSSTYERMKSHGKENAGKVAWGVENLSGKFKPYQSRDTIFVQRATMAKIFEEGKWDYKKY